MHNPPRARKSDLVVQEYENELLVYDLKTDRAYCLNSTSWAVWNLLDGESGPDELAGKLSDKLGSKVSEEVVWLALRQLAESGLIEERIDFGSGYLTMDRREMIRQACLASAVALPMISSIVAPTAAMAQSGVGALGSACFSSTECDSGNCVGLPKRCCAFGAFSSFLPNEIVCASTNNDAKGMCCSGKANRAPGSDSMCVTPGSKAHACGVF